MSQLELVWKLESQNSLLDNYKKKLEIINNNSEIQNLETLFNEANNQLDDLKTKLEANKQTLYKDNNNLKEFDFKLLEIEKDLYDGSITDIKQLKYLSDEKDNLGKQIDILETNIIKLMETSERMYSDISIIELNLNEITNKISGTKNYLKLMSNELVEKINLEEKTVKELSKDIDSSILHRYKVLRKSKGSGVVAVKNYICSGCNMLVPTYLGEKLKSKNEIVFCESCGRILYFISDK